MNGLRTFSEFIRVPRAESVPSGRLLVWTILIALVLAPAAFADYGQLRGRSMVVPGQGITATSRVTEVVRFNITESNTDDPQTGVFDDDGGLELRRVQVSFSDFRGIDPSNPGSEIAFVSLYRITQDIDNALFNFDRDFDLANNILLARARVTGTVVNLNVPCIELASRINAATCPGSENIALIAQDPNAAPNPNANTLLYQGGNAFVLNNTVIFMVAIETDATIGNNDQFSVSVRLEASAIAHQNGAGNSFGTLVFGSNVITVVDSAGDLMPFPDVVTGGAFDHFFPFEPHNYRDLAGQHPDALNILEDMDVPEVLPSESSRTAVIGIELAGVHSELNFVRLNFISSRDGRNNDLDFWSDDPAGTPGVYDPFIDEIFRYVGPTPVIFPDIVANDATFINVFAGATPGVQTTRRGFDDDGDGLTDEELPNGVDDDIPPDGRIDEDLSLPTLQPLVDEDGQDYWAWYDENGNGTYQPTIDELYFDANGNGVFDLGSGIPQVSDVSERVFQGATPGFSLRPGDPYDNSLGTGADNNGNGTPETFFFRLDGDGDGESGSPLSPNLFGLVPSLISPPAPDNAFRRNPYINNWPEGDGVIGGPFVGVRMADNIDNNGNSSDYDLSLPPVGDPAGPPHGGYQVVAPAAPGAQLVVIAAGDFLPGPTATIRVVADGVDNDGDGEAESPLDAFGRAIKDGIDNDEDGRVDEGIDENVDEGINEDLGDNAFNAITTRRNAFGTYDNFLGDIDSVILYQDDGDGVFEPDQDTPISRHDPVQVDWFWERVAPPVMTMRINVDNAINGGRGATIPVTDNGTYDFFVAITLDGDDRGDYFSPGARVPNPSNVDSGIIMEDYEGVRPGDDFMISLARGRDALHGGAIGTDAGFPNASEVTKPIKAKMFVDDIIGYVPDTVQGDNSLAFQVDRPERVPLGSDDDVFVGNPYLDATSSPVGVLGINVADNPFADDDEQDFLDGITVEIQALTHDLMTRSVPFEGTFDINVSGSVVSLPDLMPLADDSTGGVGIYRDNPVAGIAGGFDPQDTPVALRNDFLQYELLAPDRVRLTLRPTAGLELPPNDSEGEFLGYDYFVVVRTSETIDHRDVFRISIPDNGVIFRSGTSVQNSGAVTSSIAANVPVIARNLTVSEPEGIIANIPSDVSGVAAIGLNMYDRSLADSGRPTNIEYVLINFANVGGDTQFTIQDLAPIGTGPNNTIRKTDGVALYRDTLRTNPAEFGGNMPIPGVFDETDQLVRAVPLIGNVDGFPNSVFLFLDPFGDDPRGDYQTEGAVGPLTPAGDSVQGERIPPNDDGPYQGDDYFVVIRPDADISNGDDFVVQVRPLVRNDVVEWPIHFKPDENNPTLHTRSADAGGGTDVILQEVNGEFRLNYSYEAIQTNTFLATSQTNTVFSDLTAINETIEAQSRAKPIIGINMNDQGNPSRTISRIEFDIISPLVAGPNMPSATVADFNPFSPTPNSGFALYRDNPNAGIPGVFDPTDIFAQLVPSGSSATQLAGNPGPDGIPGTADDAGVIRVRMTFSPGVEVPDDDLGNNAGPDFFVVVRTSNAISFRDQFRVRVLQSGITFESGPSFGNTTLSSNLITTNVPVYPTDTTGFFGASFNRNDGPEDVIGLNFLTGTKANPSSSNESLVSLVVKLNKLNGSAFTNADIAPLSSSGASSGIALYRDDGTENGRYDPADTPLNLAFAPFFAGDNEVFFRLATPLPLPARDQFVPGIDFGPDVFVVLRTSGSITQESVFSVTVKNIRFQTSVSNLVFSTGPIDGGRVNEPPYLELLNPLVGDATNGLFTLRWEDFDPDSNAFLDFFFVAEEDYQINGASFDGLAQNPITASNTVTTANNLREDPDGAGDTFVWDVSLINTSAFAPANPRLAELRVGGVITDGIADFSATSPSFLTVTNGQPTLNFTVFSGGGVIPGNPPAILEGISFNVGFNASDPEGRASLDVYLIDETAAGVLNSPPAQALFASTSRIPAASLEALSPGNIYRVNGPVINVTRSTTTSVRVTGGAGGLSDQMISGSARTFRALAHIRDIVGGSREFDNGAATPLPVRIRINPNSPPSFAFTGDLAGGGTGLEIDGDDRFEITWTDSEPDVQSNARIRLTFQNVNGGAQTTIQGLPPGSAGPIVPASQIPQTDPNNSFTWDLSGLTAGTYRVRGIIEDEISRIEVQSFVVLNRPSSFTFLNPTIDATLFSGIPLVIEWLDANPDFDDDERLRFFLQDTTTLAEITLNTTPIPVSDPTNRLEVPTGSVPPGDYHLYATLAPPPPNSAGLSNTIYALRADNNRVVLSFVENAAPSLVFDPFSLDRVIASNPLLTNPTQGGVVSDGNADIPVVWADMDDDPQTATIDLFFTTNISNPSQAAPLQGENPPNIGIVGNRVNLATDNGPGPFAGRGAFTIGASQDVFFWDISDPAAVPRGNYTVFAVVDDGINQPVQVSTPNTIRINRRPSIAFTSTLPASITRGDDITLSWTDSDPDSDARIRIFYRIDSNLDGVPEGAPVLIQDASNISENIDGIAGDTFVFDTSNILNPPLSDFGLFFTIVIEDEDNSDSDVLPAAGGVVVTPNDSPVIALVRPNVDIDQEEPNTGFVHVYPYHLVQSGTAPPLVKIEWANGQDDNAETTFALFIDNNRFGANGTPIAQTDINGLNSNAIPLTSSGVFFWDVTSGVPAGDWYIYARVDDGVNPPFIAYSEGFIRVNQPPEFEFLEPDGFDDDVFRGEIYNIVWADDDPDSEAIINLFLDNDNDLSNGFGSNIADLNGTDLALNISEDDEIDMALVSTADLVSGSYYVVAHVDDSVNVPFIFQSAYQVGIRFAGDGLQINLTNPSGASPTDPVVVTTPTMLITWVDDPVPDSRRDLSFIQFFWDTDFFGADGTMVNGTDIAFDGSVINANRIPVELRPTNPPILSEARRDQDQLEVDVSQFPTGQVLYLYALITDNGVTDENGVISLGNISSEVYASNAFVINASPSFRWIIPGPGEPASVFRPTNARGNPYPVTFEARDPDSVALIDLFLDLDTDSSTGLIPVRNPGQNIPEADGVSSVTLNLADEIPEASVATMNLDFRLLAQITDGVTITEVYSAPFTVTANQPPSVSVITPATDIVVPMTGELVIEWLDEDPDSNARISVFLDFDTMGGSGPIIPGTYETEFGVVLTGANIPEDDDNGRLLGGQRLDQFTWDLSQTPPGVYYVGVRAEDGANVTFAYSIGRVIVNSPPEFQWINPPPQGAHVVQGDAFNLQWEDMDDDPATLISLFIDPDHFNFNGNEIAVPGGNVLLQDDADNLFFNTGIVNIPAGLPNLVVTPVAVVNDGVNAPLVVRSEGSITIDFNDPPRITILEPRRETVLFDTLFTIFWEDNDPDSSALIDFFLDRDNRDANGVPIAAAQDIEEDDETDLLEVDFSVFDPGRYFIYAVIDDGFNRPYVAYAPAAINILSGTEVVEFAVFLLDGFGEIYPVGDVNFNFGSLPKGLGDTYRNIEVSADGATLIALQADGTLTQLGVPKVDLSGAVVPFPMAGNEYIDVEFTPSERGLHLLDAFGNIVPIGDAVQLAPMSPMGMFGTAMAKDMEMTRDGRGAFVLDAFGGVHAFGNAIQFNEFPFFGFDVARDIELDSQGGYILDGLGNVFPLGRSPDLSSGADFGFDIARDLLVFEKGGFYILDGQGGITATGHNALVAPSNEPASNPFFPGMDVIRDFTLAGGGAVEITDEALLAMSTVRKFEVAYRNEDLASLLPTLSIQYSDSDHPSRNQLINGTFNIFGERTARGILHEWADTVDSFGGPLAGFFLVDPVVIFSEDGNSATVQATARRSGFRAATAELEINVPPNPPLVLFNTAAERDDFGNALTFVALAPTTFFMRDVGDHRGVILYIDKSFPEDFGQAPEALEWSDEYSYQFNKQGRESFRTTLPGRAVFRVVFATAVPDLPNQIPPDPRPITVGYIDWSELEDVDLTFTVRREGPRDWKIVSIEPIRNLIPPPVD